MGYQVMWFRIYAGRFGSTNLTFLLVLASFIGGLGLGSLASRRLGALLHERRRWRNPLSLVGGIEVAVALTALLSLAIDPSVLGLGGSFPYRPDDRGFFQPVPALQLETVVAALGVLVPTFLMGTTFPILCHAFRRRSVFPSELYAWNTMGACAGVLLGEFVLLAYLGHGVAFVALVFCNVLVGGGFAALSPVRWGAAGLGEREDGEDIEDCKDAKDGKDLVGKGATRSPVLAGIHPSVVLTVAGLSGFVSGALEVDMFRAVRFAGAITDAAMSFTSFWAIVAIFAASWTVRALGPPRPMVLRLALPGALVAHAASWYWLHDIRGWFNRWFVDWVASQSAADPGLAVAGEVYPLSGSLWLVLGFTGVVVFPAYYLVSLLLPTVCNAVQFGRRHLGLAYGLNTLAFCLGAILFTSTAPGVSLFYAVKLLFVVLAAAAGLALTVRADRPVPIPAAAIALAVCVAAAFFVPARFDASFFPADELPARHPVRAMKSNGTHTTFVVEKPDGDVLYFNSHPMSGTSLHGQRYMSLMAHVPLLAQEDPEKVLLICFGVGNTARAIAAHETVERIDVVDLNDKVFETAPEFAATNGRVYDDPRVRFIHDDGRRFLERTAEKYDLVTSEPPPPRAEGVYRLYSVEYYRAVLEHLTPSGMMTQWLPINALSRDAIDRIIAAFVEVFPQALLFVGSGDQLILLGGRQPFDAALLERRFGESESVLRDLAGVGVREPLSILARVFRMGPELRRDVAGVRPISDQRNDLALAVTDPFDPPRLDYDPNAVLRALDSEDLQSSERLAATFADLHRLKAAVPDFPGL